MLNEPNPEAVPVGGGGGAGGAGVAGGMAGDTPGGSHMSYIQVTPQEKEAIERVRRSTTLSLTFTVSEVQCCFTRSAVIRCTTLVNMKHKSG